MNTNIFNTCIFYSNIYVWMGAYRKGVSPDGVQVPVTWQCSVIFMISYNLFSLLLKHLTKISARKRHVVVSTRKHDNFPLQKRLMCIAMWPPAHIIRCYITCKVPVIAEWQLLLINRDIINKEKRKISSCIICCLKHLF